MKEITVEEILAMISQKSVSTPINDVEYEYEYDINQDVEMYSNSNKKEKKKRNKNTFQQSSVNVRGQAPISSFQAQAPGVKEDQESPGDRTRVASGEKYGRRFNLQEDKIIEMHLQFAHPKIGDRYGRMKAYISIKTDNDTRYMIFLRSALKTALHEVKASIKKDGCKVLESELQNIENTYSEMGLYAGRVKYKPTKGSKIEDHHRSNLPLSLLTAWIQDGYWHAKFYFLDRDYEFILDEPLTDKQKGFYSAQGTWTDDDESTLTIQQAFGG